MTAAKMRGAVFADIGELAVMERDVPVLERPNEVILDVQACGICGTDLHILTDYVQYLLHPVGVIPTGPNFVIKQDAQAVIDLSKEGIR